MAQAVQNIVSPFQQLGGEVVGAIGGSGAKNAYMNIVKAPFRLLTEGYNEVSGNNRQREEDYKNRVRVDADNQIKEVKNRQDREVLAVDTERQNQQNRRVRTQIRSATTGSPNNGLSPLGALGQMPAGGGKKLLGE